MRILCMDAKSLRTPSCHPDRKYLAKGICSRCRVLLIALSLSLVSCDQGAKITPKESIPVSSPSPAIKTPTAAPQSVKTASQEKIKLPISNRMTKVAENLVFEAEVGGEWQYKKWPHPEAPDARMSGITVGLGYDNAENAPILIKQDWGMLPNNAPERLAATHPYRGREAQKHVSEVKDITVSWENSVDVFYRIDLPRVDAACRRAYPGFDSLRDKARDAIRSLVFNRGTSMSGPNRTEMRDLVPAIKNQDYNKMASLVRQMTRVWRGSSIYNGMKSRREAEARLIESI